jgi:hypothetical protein
MLTRAGPRSDFPTDTSVRKQGIDPRDADAPPWCSRSCPGNRYLTSRAAEDLTAREVRRLLAIFVKRGEASELSPSERRWVALPSGSRLADPTLARPVEIRALLDAAAADDAVVDALDAEGNRRLREISSTAFDRASSKPGWRP